MFIFGQESKTLIIGRDNHTAANLDSALVIDILRNITLFLVETLVFIYPA
jgi:hypothetical protein